MDLKFIDPFDNVSMPQTQTTDSVNQYGAQYLNNVNRLSVGSGSQVMRGDQQGLWLGGATFSEAPFSVSMAGVVNLTGNESKFIFTKDGIPNIVIGNI